MRGQMKASKIKGGRGKGLGIINVVANLIIFSGGGGGAIKGAHYMLKLFMLSDWYMYNH